MARKGDGIFNRIPSGPLEVIMNGISIKTMKDKIDETNGLNDRMQGLTKFVTDISTNLRSVNFRVESWYPDKIHSEECGGIHKDIYFGFGEIDLEWDLIIRTIERDSQSDIFLGQTKLALYECRNATIIEKILNLMPEFLNALNACIVDQIKNCIHCLINYDQFSNLDYEFPLINISNK
jgi:hypothetical protein